MSRHLFRCLCVSVKVCMYYTKCISRWKWSQCICVSRASNVATSNTTTASATTINKVKICVLYEEKKKIPKQQQKKKMEEGKKLGFSLKLLPVLFILSLLPFCTYPQIRIYSIRMTMQRISSFLLPSLSPRSNRAFCVLCCVHARVFPYFLTYYVKL